MINLKRVFYESFTELRDPPLHFNFGLTVYTFNYFYVATENKQEFECT